MSTAVLAQVSTPPRASLRRGSWLRPWWPVDALLVFFPLWFVLGLSGIIFPILAVPLAVKLFMMPNVRIPRGAGWYVAFLGWVLLSGVNLPKVVNLVFFGWRFVTYVSAFVFMLAIYNAPEDELSTERVTRNLSLLWVYTIAGGFLAISFPYFSFSSPVESVLPAIFRTNGFIKLFVHPQLADVQEVLGNVPRPAAPFVYTNNWGSSITLLLPFVLLRAHIIGTPAIRRTVVVLGALALVPFVYSLNRSAWSTLAVMAIVAVLTASPRTRSRAILSVAGAALLVGVLVVYTPLGGVVTNRLDNGHSDNTRQDLVAQSFEVTNESPIIGYGRPLPNIRFPLRSDIGTQGFLWTLMVCQGYVGMTIFGAWLLSAMVKSWWGRRRAEARFALFVLAGFLLQLPFYDMIPYQLHFIAFAIALERRGARDSLASRGATQVDP
jgi:O-Antigen ligase